VLGTAKKLKVLLFFPFWGHLGGKEVWRLGRSQPQPSEAGWVEGCWGEARSLTQARSEQINVGIEIGTGISARDLEPYLLLLCRDNNTVMFDVGAPSSHD
jgi:hypothetical protein